MINKVEDLFDKYLGDDDGPRNWDWDDLYEIDDDSDFEYLVADLWEEIGYDTQRTKGSGDDGVDVIAVKNGYVRSNIQKVVIEAKHYRGDNTVGASVIREMPGAEKMHDADMSVVVTSNIFTNHAKRTAEKLDVELVNGKELIQRLNQSELPPPELEFLE